MSRSQTNPKHKQTLGRWGESVASTHLEANGFTIVTRNWRCRIGEIDLVAHKEDTLHFCEVKTRRGTQHGTPEEAITPAKAKKLIATALFYIGHHDLDNTDWQIDLIAIQLDPKGKLLRCEHLPNILY